MEVQRDFRELLGSFSNHGVEFLIVGGYALAFHGAPRFTGDLDLYVRPTEENSRRIMDALRDFGFGSVGLGSEDFQRSGRIVQLGVPPVRVDLVTSIDGVSWDEAWSGRVEGSYGDLRVPFIGRPQFLANKRASGRKKDLADIEAIEGSS